MKLNYRSLDLRVRLKINNKEIRENASFRLEKKKNLKYFSSLIQPAILLLLPQH